MTKRRLKKPVEYALYGLVFVSVFGAIFSIESATSPALKKPEIEYVSKTIIEDEEPVVAIHNVIKRPYNNENVKIVKDFYDYKDESVEQENSIIYYSDTYLQSSGVSYSSGESFDVVSILDGTVSSVSENDLLGNIVEIDHGNGIIGYYQSLNDVVVKNGDPVVQGQTLGKSGFSNIAKDLNDHLNFELSINGKLVNPEEYYDRNISDLGEH